MKYNFNFSTYDFKKLIENNNSFVDKSLFIKEVINESSDVILIPRPRRFGKSLNFSMLKYFFDMKEDSFNLFKDLKISKEQECMEHMNKYPVVLISMKDAAFSNWPYVERGLRVLMSDVYKKYKTELFSNLDRDEKEYYEKVMSEKVSEVELSFSLSRLTRYLKDRYKKEVIVLIDEYDAIMTSLYGEEEFEKCMDFFKIFYGSTLKGNESLHRALMTGITRVAKEGIFSGLNNVMVCGVTDREFGSRFGFLEEEIKDVIIESNLNYKEVKNYYNGYNFGGNLVYNPWSVANCLKRGKYGSYWKNTSGNDLVKELVKKGGPEVKYSFEKMLEGESVNLEVEDNVNLRELEVGDIYSLLLQSGYLTYEEKDGVRKYKLPNKEVKDFFKELLSEIDKKIYEENLEDYFERKEWVKFEKTLKESVEEALSYYDIPTDKGKRENFYHTLLLGMFLNFRNYKGISNRESGMGRPDIIMKRKDGKENIVIELKAGSRSGDVMYELEKAKDQIIMRKYGEDLKGNVIKIAIGFVGKEVKLEVVD